MRLHTRLSCRELAYTPHDERSNYISPARPDDPGGASARGSRRGDGRLWRGGRASLRGFRVGHDILELHIIAGFPDRVHYPAAGRASGRIGRQRGFRDSQCFLLFFRGLWDSFGDKIHLQASNFQQNTIPFVSHNNYLNIRFIRRFKWMANPLLNTSRRYFDACRSCDWTRRHSQVNPDQDSYGVVCGNSCYYVWMGFGN